MAQRAERQKKLLSKCWSFHLDRVQQQTMLTHKQVNKWLSSRVSLSVVEIMCTTLFINVLLAVGSRSVIVRDMWVKSKPIYSFW